ncbi:hypothetical protein ASPZODRAFT_147350 [Penicilliopsis zonata CBS 506.65]|uniref:Zn(2)-C6 fungal-type domain-containing protein n=1 Tax=Penicilliopsis zonata CBS 506.65 TaxID=1073090 RepID=A0A1L9S5B1_9EURO|nr:hypothetical protein ASPZODRAFT_147350 [Penicilliopsis zonata CBS 506.65]OJJ42363.1 hypothetical protein ASPZODRAFT_147350 [Penicilliopsis zonata CBS 506.65]
MSDTNPSLRASCERCRAHKLRCVPSIAGDPTSACQRCAKAKLQGSCKYTQRLKTGRTRLPGGGGDDGQQEAEPRKLRRVERECLTQPPLPGMGTFALHAASSLSPSSSTCPSSFSCSLDCVVPPRPFANSDQGTFADAESMAIDSFPWYETGSDMEQPDLQAFPPLLPDSDDGLNATTGSVVDEYMVSSVLSAEWDRVLLPFAQRGDGLVNDEIGLAMSDTKENMATPQLKDHFNTLTGLLAKMSHYETQISQFSASPPLQDGESHNGHKLDNYPIGDALFLSQRFHQLASAAAQGHNNCNPDGDDQQPVPELGNLQTPLSCDIPTMLLILSCYLMLTRIYSTIFDDLHVALTELAEQVQCAARTHRRDSSLEAFREEANMYRGLRLVQLQPTCVCVDSPSRETATRAHRAVAVLLGSLGLAEAALELPSDIRILAGSKNCGYEEEPLVKEGGTINGTSSNGSGSICKLMNEHFLYGTMQKQARQLQQKIDELKQLLQDLLNVY